MQGYLVRYYLLVLVGIVGFLSLYPLLNTIANGTNLFRSLPTILIAAGPLAGVVHYFEFRRQKVWPLYDNLRISRYRSIAILSSAVSALGFILQIL